MNTRSHREWLLLGAAGLTPFVGVGLVRHLTGDTGPRAAIAAAAHEDADDAADAREALHIVDRTVVVPPNEAVELAKVAASDVASWATPLFTPAPAKDLHGPPSDTTPTTAIAAAPIAPTASAFADRFRLSSLMATRGVAVAVIDRKLRRMGDDVGSGVVIERIDLEDRTVYLRTPDGTILERRPAH